MTSVDEGSCVEMVSAVVGGGRGCLCCCLWRWRKLSTSGSGELRLGGCWWQVGGGCGSGVISVGGISVEVVVRWGSVFGDVEKFANLLKGVTVQGGGS